MRLLILLPIVSCAILSAAFKPYWVEPKPSPLAEVRAWAEHLNRENTNEDCEEYWSVPEEAQEGFTGHRPVWNVDPKRAHVPIHRERQNR